MANEYLNEYPPASLSEKEVEKIRSLEKQLTEEMRKPILLMAFENGHPKQ
ncbi:hypothetical protein [Aneurinibacillus aneurinilyticus]|jgi:hypothetical protein|uniref:Uncharacterized protein n=1 Tax=Aneurinibacillus aneurinilyticus ATCC 12856 TaxID=649747 RepID=U1XXY6_ANEAE|nr:hypothetical protein [Aneurinibacillus aneurinilyticus]ERI04857.1 hypothetical protein HMPREF0083_05935 [Aneurinibacillus aneurinilyticus ATCC 12856]MCI1693423.1 hypothetical protein [Aneurinibacillus aneurinilyticus]MED0706010.1 hypothetical protein [Aneurinibacillus aneurinilyticus]MED0721651.1 hypothetical protein [Aneurinibacillus aneurinilyticus]MED0730930.1 hypothetical protein [Aneurinibacillus aneurinilyticus]